MTNLQKWKIEVVAGFRKREGPQGGEYIYKRAIRGIPVMELFYILSMLVDTQTHTDKTV